MPYREVGAVNNPGLPIYTASAYDRGRYGDFGLFDSGLVDGAFGICELCAFQICFDHRKIST